MFSWRLGSCKVPRGAALFLLVLLLTGCARTDDEWRRDLASEDPFVRALGAIGLGVEAPREAGAAVPELLLTIDRPDLGLEREAAWVLVHVGPHHVPLLLEELVTNPLMSDDRRGAILNALQAAGPAVAPKLVACLRGPGPFLAGELGEVLVALGEPAVPAIASMLDEEEDVRLRLFAAFLLGRLGPLAGSGLPALRRAAESSDPELREAARVAIAAVAGG